MRKPLLAAVKNSTWIFTLVLDNSKLIFQFFPWISSIKIFSRFLFADIFSLKDFVQLVYIYSKRWVCKWKALLLCRFWRVFFSARRFCSSSDRLRTRESLLLLLLLLILPRSAFRFLKLFAVHRTSSFHICKLVHFPIC